MLDKVQPTRRTMLKLLGGVTFGLGANGAVSILGAGAAAQLREDAAFGAYVTIHDDDTITVVFVSTEMGQGVSTALPMILAEDLDADWSQVRVKQLDNGAPDVYGNPAIGGILYTAGSSSIESYFNDMRLAGAQTRRVLMHSVAAHWDVAFEEVSTRPSVLVHEPTGREMSYSTAATTLKLATDVAQVTEEDLKDPADWRIIGTDIPRVDVPAKTRGEMQYSIDVNLPDMTYAAQLLAPVEGETPLEIDDAQARAVRGVVDIIALNNSVNVIAESFDMALRARDLLNVTWSQTSPMRTSDSTAEMRDVAAAAQDRDQQATFAYERGDTAANLEAEGTRSFTATYTTEPVYHAQMEPLNVVASVDADGKGAEAWIGTQSQTVTAGVAAGVLQTTPDRIKLNILQMGGAFGRRTVFAREHLRDALLLSRSVKRPVKLLWTREDDVRAGWFRPASAHQLSASVDAKGAVVALKHRIASSSIMQFVNPGAFDAMGGQDPLVTEGTESVDYEIAHLKSEHVVTPRRARVAAWRGIGWGPNLYAREVFIDELAAFMGDDPVALRRRLLANSARGQAVLEAVLEMSSFGNAPDGRAHGIAFAGYKETRGAGVAEVSVDPETQAIKVHRFWAAVDPGIAVNPINIEAQVEGGIIYGLSGLGRERISFSGGQVEQSNFYDYDVMRARDVPEVQVRILQSGAAPSGAGEIGVPMTGGAVANAVYALNGQRLRNMPFSLEA